MWCSGIGRTFGTVLSKALMSWDEARIVFVGTALVLPLALLLGREKAFGLTVFDLQVLFLGEPIIRLSRGMGRVGLSVCAALGGVCEPSSSEETSMTSFFEEDELE